MAIPKPNIATAAKTATISAAVNADVLAAAAKQSPLINANQVQNQGTDGSSQDKKPRPGFEGPSPNIPDVSKPGYTPATADSKQATINNALGLVSKTDAMKQLAGVGTSSTAAQSEKDKLTDLAGSSKNNKTDFYQGFDSKPTSLGVDPVSGLNPMAPYQGGSVGGLLGGAAQSGVKTLSDFNKTGMIAADAIDALLAIGTFAAAAAAATPPGGLALAAAAAIKTTYDAASASAYSNADSFYNALESSEDPTNPANQAHLDLEKAKAENARKAGGGAGMPNPENSGSNVNIITQTLIDN